MQHLHELMMLRKEAVDPVTGYGIVPPVGQFASLDSLSMARMTYSVDHEAGDLNILHSVLETWTSSTQDRRLSVSIDAETQGQTRDNMLEFMRKVGDIVEEYFSGVHTFIHSHHK